MSKKRNVQIVTDEGVNYGQNINPTDFTKMQDFAHLHSENITKDFCTQLYETDVAGFNPAPIGLSVDMSDGRIYQTGLQFDGEPVQLTFEEAHPTHPRIDLIVATVSQNSPEELTYTLFQRIRTDIELGNGTPPYQPVQYEIPREKHHKVTLTIKKGVASATPVQPALSEGEIPLWAVTIPAAATALISGNFADLRRLVANLRQMRTEINNMINTLITMQGNITTALAYQYDTELVNWDNSFGGNRNIHSVMEEIGSKLQVLRFRYPSMLTGDGRIQAVGNMDNTTPVIDIPVGTLVQFGDKFVTIQPDAFADEDLNARRVTSGISNTNELFDGMGEEFDLENAQNTIRLNAPTTTKYLYLNRDGSLYFTDNPTGSNANECLLLRSEYKGSGDPPELLNYINLRNAVIAKTGIATADADSKQFINDIGIPPGVGYTRAYGVKDSDKSIYELTLSGISAIDDVVTVIGVADDDKWVVEMHIFSIY